jgi:uncharacterized protein YegP (UPF0339 family)
VKVETYEDQGGRWRWRIKANNAKIVACSGESFYDKHNAKRGAQAFIRSIISAAYGNRVKFAVEG